MTSGRMLFEEWSARFGELMDHDPTEAVRQARGINFDSLGKATRVNMMNLCAGVLVDAGAMTGQLDAVQEGLSLFRILFAEFPRDGLAYNIANGLIAIVSFSQENESWLDRLERTRQERREARRHLWAVANNDTGDDSLRTQAWTNLGNQFSNSLRVFEAHDARLAALEKDPQNGVAAISGAQGLMWLYHQVSCSDVTLTEASMLAKIACRNMERVVEYVGAQAAREIIELAERFDDPPPRKAHLEPFLTWLEDERLALGPTVELVDPALGKVDWLMLPGIFEREQGAEVVPPPIFAMFNSLKSDFILARDLAWRAGQEDAWPATGRFSDTLDYAGYGPGTSALILAHRTALDILDKVAVTANYYFELGKEPKDVSFGRIWRGERDKKTKISPLAENVRKLILSGVTAIYGLVELAEDYENEQGILRSQKDIRNAGTHRFVVLHDIGDPVRCRQAAEIERHTLDGFNLDTLSALRIARSAIQMLTLAITQYEKILRQSKEGDVGSLEVPGHDYIRGRVD